MPEWGGCKPDPMPMFEPLEPRLLLAIGPIPTWTHLSSNAGGPP